MIYFTSDTHYNHANIIGYCKRPFANVDEMNREMIRRWNERVKPDDLVYHLGDFALGKKEDMAPVFDQLVGNKFLIIGNHDSATTKNLSWLGFSKEMTAPNYFLLHNPALAPAWLENGNRVILHGHMHGTAGLHPFPKYKDVRYVDVGVDCWDYRPVTFEEIMERLGGQK